MVLTTFSLAIAEHNVNTVITQALRAAKCNPFVRKTYEIYTVKIRNIYRYSVKHFSHQGFLNVTWYTRTVFLRWDPFIFNSERAELFIMHEQHAKNFFYMTHRVVDEISLNESSQNNSFLFRKISYRKNFCHNILFPAWRSKKTILWRQSRK
jgi:hypothetical protein